MNRNQSVCSAVRQNGESIRESRARSWPCALLALAALALPASAQLTADFSASPLSGTLPLDVKFLEATTGGSPNLWQWDFGDGSTSVQKNPKHTYTVPGVYSVKLKVTTAGFLSDSELKTDLITVLPPDFQGAFSATPVTGSLPLLVTFTDESGPTAATSWSWDFGDGAGSNEQHPSHLYQAPGSFTVVLVTEVYGFGDTVVAQDLVVVDALPLVPSFSSSVTMGDQPLPVQFTDTSTGPQPTAWLWDFGNGASSTEQHPTYTYDTPSLHRDAARLGLRPDRDRDRAAAHRGHVGCVHAGHPGIGGARCGAAGRFVRGRHQWRHKQLLELGVQRRRNVVRAGSRAHVRLAGHLLGDAHGGRGHGASDRL